MHMINKRLLVGNIEDAARPPAQIGALLLVAEEQDIAAPSWLTYAKIPFKEFSEPDASALCEAIDWIESHIAENRIMVCCRAGMGRSVSVVIAYLCCVERLSYEEAVKLVLTRRPGGVPLPKLQETVKKVLSTRRDRVRGSGDPVDPLPTAPPTTP
jgi:protein-tyrosine phosphatase